MIEILIITVIIKYKKKREVIIQFHRARVLFTFKFIKQLKVEKSTVYDTTITFKQLGDAKGYPRSGRLVWHTHRRSPEPFVKG